MSKKFAGVRNRVEGERAQHAVRVIVGRGYTIRVEGRLKDDTGYYIRTAEGPVINLYDTGSILVTGNNRHLFGDIEELKLPDTSPGVLILACSEDDAASDLSTLLSGWNVDHKCVLFETVTWIEDVARARKRGMHVLVLVSNAPYAPTASGRGPHPVVYFGLGLLVARIGRGHLSIICQDSIDMPHQREMLGVNMMRYSRYVHELDERLRMRLQSSHVRFGDRLITESRYGQRTLI